MHRNSFVNAPLLLDEQYRLRTREDLFIAGQISGVEGYVESAASGLVAGIAMARQLLGLEQVLFGRSTAIGSQAYYISHADPKHFQPMNANFGIFELNEKVRKKDRKAKLAENALKRIDEVAALVNV